jgi:hypothetical protein
MVTAGFLSYRVEHTQKRIFSPLPVGFFQPTIKTNRMINENYCYGKNNDSKKTKNTLPNQTDINATIFSNDILIVR